MSRKVWALIGGSAAVALLSAAACTVEVDDDGVGGSGASGGSTSSQGGGAGVGGSTSSQGGGAGVGGGMGACATCGEFVNADDMTMLPESFCGENADLSCQPGSSCEKFVDLFLCVCEGGGAGGGGGASAGPCATECSDTLCDTAFPLSADCLTCLATEQGNASECGNFYTTCQTDT